MKYIVGVDLGGTKIAVAVISEDGERVAGFLSEPTPVEAGPEGVVVEIVRLVDESIAIARESDGADIELIGMGIGAPGPLDTRSGMVLLTPNLGWRDMPLRDRMKELTGLDAALDNDANCAILGETWKGAARGGRIVIGVTIGTGIGGGIVVGGKLYHGASDVAGEFGHMTIDSTGRRCGCGNYGCLEAYASGPAIARRAIEAVEAGTESQLAQHAGGNLEGVTAETVFRAAEAGDELAVEVVRETARFLGIGIANLINVLNPETVVVCGGVTRAGDTLLNPLRTEVRKRAFKPAVDACRIVPGELKDTAGVMGAVRSFQLQAAGER